MYCIFVVLTVLLLLPNVAARQSKVGCYFKLKKSFHYYKDGDLIIGGMITRIPILNYQSLLAFVFAISEINRNPHLLPNITLGFHIADPCSDEERAVTGMIDILAGRESPVPNFHCGSLQKLVGVVDGISSKVTLLLAKMFGMYKIPQISYSTLDPILSDKVQFPTFYRTVPNDNFQCMAIVELLKHFSWTFVGLLLSEDDLGLMMSKKLIMELEEQQICVAFLQFIPIHYDTEKTKIHDVFRGLRSNTVNAVILYGDRKYILTFHLLLYNLDQYDILQKVWIISTQWDISNDLEYFFLNFKPFNGSLAFTLPKRTMPGFKDFLHEVNPDSHPNDILIEYIWFMLFECKWHAKRDDPEICMGKETIQNPEYEVFYNDTSMYSNSIYTAVYALAHALHMMYSEKIKKNQHVGNIKAWELNHFLKNLQFTTPNGEKLHFDENGDMYSKLDIMNWIVNPNDTLEGIRVGSFKHQGSSSSLIINESLIRWPTAFNQTPGSYCSETCTPGYRRAQRKGFPACCYDCISCPQGEISNRTDAEICFSCPDTEWANENQTKCTYKAIIYLSYGDALGISLTLLSGLFSLLTCSVMMIFIKHRNTPIVKANNRDLSYILLLSIKMCFLCILLFIGHPDHVTCILRQTVFAITFTICLSSILAKTVTVIIAFNATKPGSRIRNWMGSRVSISILVFCFLIQVTICAGWLGISPPFPYYNIEDEVGVIVVQCNEGSTFGFYSALGFLGLLALVSFIVAFFARNLPDVFNEAKFITFSMLVFCSVWISFIPAYLSTKGKYVVAVEIFAILASSLALLGCIFIPKCFIILVQPECNTVAFVKK
ncbi:hypothetical protein GDO86_016455 [Hymenochirus boettgeri]|uniref:Vomeronasal type-2 receptor 26-like n=1 Tax=Hymenochirus boettgeri TaxID=247094 RepID=A0A8T2JX27_9PIPI|nr:hypothetical protein GDO86_016454 [Hymenochirus boettgeri]KAG8449795.1 hypothetical protein GDO86_016455 [Hymenochirus boettgeri]